MMHLSVIAFHEISFGFPSCALVFLLSGGMQSKSSNPPRYSLSSQKQFDLKKTNNKLPPLHLAAGAIFHTWTAVRRGALWRHSLVMLAALVPWQNKIDLKQTRVKDFNP